jgi:DNA replication protein DnaC
MTTKKSSRAIDAVNTLLAFQAAGRLKTELNKYLKPRVLALDELGYLPMYAIGIDRLSELSSRSSINQTT